jgi:hypothetical protein
MRAQQLRPPAQQRQLGQHLGGGVAHSHQPCRLHTPLLQARQRRRVGAQIGLAFVASLAERSGANQHHGRAL